jgi:hypothetical protein
MPKYNTGGSLVKFKKKIYNSSWKYYGSRMVHLVIIKNPSITQSSACVSDILLFFKRIMNDFILNRVVNDINISKGRAI